MPNAAHDDARPRAQADKLVGHRTATLCGGRNCAVGGTAEARTTQHNRENTANEQTATTTRRHTNKETRKKRNEKKEEKIGRKGRPTKEEEAEQSLLPLYLGLLWLLTSLPMHPFIPYSFKRLGRRAKLARGTSNTPRFCLDGLWPCPQSALGPTHRLSLP